MKCSGVNKIVIGGASRYEHLTGTLKHHGEENNHAMYQRENIKLSVHENRWKLRDVKILPDKQYFWAPLGNFYAPDKVTKWYVHIAHEDKRANKKFFMKTKQEYDKEIIRVTYATKSTTQLDPFLMTDSEGTREGKKSGKCTLM